MNNGVGPDGYFEEFYLTRDWRFYRGMLSRVVANSEPGPILDLGAGCGYLVEACQRWGWECKGLEGSDNAVRIAKERFPEIDIRKFLLSEPLPFENGYFSTAILNQVIEHLEPTVAKRCIEEVYRVLRPGGALIIFSPCKHNKREMKEDSTHINMYTPYELEQLLSSKGFGPIRRENYPLPLLGSNKLGKYLMSIIFRIFPLEVLSATANCIAYKPNPSC